MSLLGAIFGALFILIWGLAEESGLSIGAKKYHNSAEYRYQQWLWNEVKKNTLDKNVYFRNNDKK